jgi:putative oxidoreductase
MTAPKLLSTLLTKSSPRHIDVGLLILRLWFGVVMALSHGWGKISNLSSFSESVAKIGLPAPALMAALAASGEFIGGILLALGLFTRAAGPMLAGTMLVAAFHVHASDPFGKKEFALAYAAAAIVLTITGAGKLSLDHRLFARAVK